MVTVDQLSEARDASIQCVDLLEQYSNRARFIWGRIPTDDQWKRWNASFEATADKWSKRLTGRCDLHDCYKRWRTACASEVLDAILLASDRNEPLIIDGELIATTGHKAAGALMTSAIEEVERVGFCRVLHDVPGLRAAIELEWKYAVAGTRNLPVITHGAGASEIDYQGKTYTKQDPEACELLQVLIDAYPKGKRIGLRNAFPPKPERLVRKLPQPIQDIIDTNNGGSILRPKATQPV